MKAYRITDLSIDGLVQHDEPAPTPIDGEVLVRIKAVSLNYKDLLFVRPLDQFGIQLPKPTIPLSDCAGEVIAIGAGVTQFTVGDRVAATVLQGWIDGVVPVAQYECSLGVGLEGVLAEERAFAENGLVKLPANLSFEEGSTLACAGVTAWGALSHAKAGEWALTLGTGGVSTFAVQLGEAMGLRMIVTSSSDAKAQHLLDLGAEHAVNYVRTPEWDEEVLRITGGEGVRTVVENVSGASVSRSIRATAPGGHITIVGLLDRGKIDPTEIMYRPVNVYGSRIGSKAMFEDMNTLIEAKDVHPRIDRTFAFDQAREAYRYLESANHVGKVVITIPS